MYMNVYIYTCIYACIYFCIYVCMYIQMERLYIEEMTHTVCRAQHLRAMNASTPMP